MTEPLPKMCIVEFRDDLAQVFHDINAQWIEAMFVMEATDRKVLENPRSIIIDRDGVILFVEAGSLGNRRHGCANENERWCLRTNQNG